MRDCSTSTSLLLTSLLFLFLFGWFFFQQSSIVDYLRVSVSRNNISTKNDIGRSMKFAEDSIVLNNSPKMTRSNLLPKLKVKLKLKPREKDLSVPVRTFDYMILMLM